MGIDLSARGAGAAVAGAVLALTACNLGNPPVQYPAFAYGEDIVVLDVEGDGDLDQVANDSNRAHHVLLNDGTGAYTLTSHDVGLAGSLLGAGDFDGDGHDDLVVLDADFVAETRSLAIRHGDGSGGFAPPTELRVYGWQDPAPAVRVADVDDDGHDDIVIAQYGSGETYLGDGAGGFTHVGRDGSDGEIQMDAAEALTDVDGDGHVDIVRSGVRAFDCTPWYCQRQGGLAVWLGRGDGTFAAPVHTGYGPVDPNGPPVRYWGVLAAGDVDGDGHVDLARMTAGGGMVLHHGDGTPAFTAPVTVAEVDPSACDVHLVEIDGDGHLDVVTSEQTGVAVHFGDGAGGFAAKHGLSAPPSSYLPGECNRRVAVDDLSGDGLADVAIHNGGELMVHVNAGGRPRH